MDKRTERMRAKESVGRFVQTKCGEVLLVVENDYPIVRVFDGKDMFTINFNKVSQVADSRLDFPRKVTSN